MLERGLPAADRPREGPQLARELRTILERTVRIELDDVSDAPRGQLDDGLPARRERVATIPASQGPVDLLLERQARPGEPYLWRVSSRTVARIPELWEEYGYGRLGQVLPAPFFDLRWLGLAPWQWLGLGLLLLAAHVVSWLVVVQLLLRALRAVVARTRTELDDLVIHRSAAPSRLALFAILGVAGSPLLGLSVRAQGVLLEVAKALFIVALAWFAFRLVDAAAHVLTRRLTAHNHAIALSIVPMGRRALQLFVGTVGLIVLLQNLGVNVTGILAGLGIGGLAIALAAQKTVENLFGGVSLIVDQPVRVGDFCRFGERSGVIEDIGLRSTRIRTLDRTLLAVPNAEFAALQIENFAARDRFWFHHTLGLRLETTADQAREVIVQVKRLLVSHPKVSPEPARVRLIRLADSSMDIEVFAYVLTREQEEFLAVQEELLFALLAIVERAGSGLAYPSQTLYLTRDGGLDAARGKEAEARVAALRAEGKLPFPTLSAEEAAALRGTLPWPPPGTRSGGGSAGGGAGS